MNNFLIKTAEACIPIGDPRGCDGWNTAQAQSVLKVSKKQQFLEILLNPVTITSGAILISILLIFILIRTRKNIQSRFLKMLNLIGIIIFGSILVYAIFYGIILLKY